MTERAYESHCIQPLLNLDKSSGDIRLSAICHCVTFIRFLQTL